MNKYVEIERLDIHDAKEKIPSLKGKELVLALLGIYDLEEVDWVQETYLDHLNHKDEWVAGAAATGLGHLARVSGLPDKNKVLNRLRTLETDSKVLESKVRSAMNDIKVFQG